MKKSDNRREEMSKMYEKTTIGFFHIDGQNVFGKIRGQMTASRIFTYVITTYSM